ncbi:hypothetical protein WA158_004499 [Blastocystis sp. Blastoise]
MYTKLDIDPNVDYTFVYNDNRRGSISGKYLIKYDHCVLSDIVNQNNKKIWKTHTINVVDFPYIDLRILFNCIEAFEKFKEQLSTEELINLAHDCYTVFPDSLKKLKFSVLKTILKRKGIGEIIKGESILSENFKTILNSFFLESIKDEQTTIGDSYVFLDYKVFSLDHIFYFFAEQLMNKKMSDFYYNILFFNNVISIMSESFWPVKESYVADLRFSEKQYLYIFKNRQILQDMAHEYHYRLVFDQPTNNYKIKPWYDTFRRIHVYKDDKK